MLQFVFLLSIITDSKIPLKLNVKDKDEPIGQIVIQVSEIPIDEHFLKWVPIGPHKKNTNPSGELCLDCWVEDFYESDEDIMTPSISTKPKKYLNKTLQRLTGRSPEPPRKQRDGLKVSPTDRTRRHSYATGIMSIKGSVSVEDLTRPNNINKVTFRNKNNLLAPDAYTNPLTHTHNDVRRASSAAVLEHTHLHFMDQQKRNSIGDLPTISQLPIIKEKCYPPKVLNIVPNSGASAGGTLIQITGKYLGVSRDDITRLMVAGCNCLSTLEYYTAQKIMCTTSESEGTGPVSISTKSGGMSSSKMMFQFLEKKEELKKEEEEGGNGMLCFFVFTSIISYLPFSHNTLECQYVKYRPSHSIC